MNGVFEHLDLKVGDKKQVGIAHLHAFEITKDETRSITNMRLVMDGGYMFRLIEGRYVRLLVNGELMMSDTSMEKISNRDFVANANGRVFIAGLGVGLIVNALRNKLLNGIVTEITVIEKYQDVIDLIAPYYSDLKINYVLGDVLDYKLPKGDLYDTIYFDIWPTISEDNLPEMAKLHNRFKFNINRTNSNKWMGSWMQKYLQQQKAKYSRSYW